MTTEMERHYSPNEIAERLNLSSRTVRRMFQDEPGVLKLGEPFKAKKRGYVTLRIPESVLRRVCSSLGAGRR